MMGRSLNKLVDSEYDVEGRWALECEGQRKS